MLLWAVSVQKRFGHWNGFGHSIRSEEAFRASLQLCSIERSSKANGKPSVGHFCKNKQDFIAPSGFPTERQLIGRRFSARLIDLILHLEWVVCEISLGIIIEAIRELLLVILEIYWRTFTKNAQILNSSSMILALKSCFKFRLESRDH